MAEAYASAIQYEKTKQKHATEEVKKQKIWTKHSKYWMFLSFWFIGANLFFTISKTTAKVLEEKNIDIKNKGIKKSKQKDMRINFKVD